MAKRAGRAVPAPLFPENRVTIHFVRHAQSAYHGRGYDVTPRGWEQAVAEGKRLAKALPANAHVIAVSSPAERAYATADLILNQLGKAHRERGFSLHPEILELDALRPLGRNPAFFEKLLKAHGNAGVGPRWARTDWERVARRTPAAQRRNAMLGVLEPPRLSKRAGANPAGPVSFAYVESPRQVNRRFSVALDDVLRAAREMAVPEGRQFHFIVVGHEEGPDAVLARLFGAGLRTRRRLGNAEPLRFDVDLKTRTGTAAFAGKRVAVSISKTGRVQRLK